MAKFAGYEISVEIEKLKIHVKGDRQIAPEIATNVANQVAGVFQPAPLIEGAQESHNGHLVIDGNSAIPARRARRRSSGTKSNGAVGVSTANPLEWQHDTGKWGTPLQAWSQPQKINWLLYVTEQEGVRANGLTPTVMSDIFERKFKAAGLLLRQNIGRDLGKNADFFGALDGRWYLKEEGKKEAAKLVAAAKGGTPAAA
jgi:hypothetical protein